MGRAQNRAMPVADDGFAALLGGLRGRTDRLRLAGSRLSDASKTEYRQLLRAARHGRLRDPLDALNSTPSQVRDTPRLSKLAAECANGQVLSVVRGDGARIEAALALSGVRSRFADTLLFDCDPDGGRRMHIWAQGAGCGGLSFAPPDALTACELPVRELAAISVTRGSWRKDRGRQCPQCREWAGDCDDATQSARTPLLFDPAAQTRLTGRAQTELRAALLERLARSEAMPEREFAELARSRMAELVLAEAMTRYARDPERCLMAMDHDLYSELRDELGWKPALRMCDRLGADGFERLLRDELALDHAPAPHADGSFASRLRDALSA